MKPEIVDRYVQIEQARRGLGDTPFDGRLEVMPAQHYLMGGVQIDKDAATSLAGVFAVGEVSAGAHGGHRLAAGGGLEVVSGGALAGESAARHALQAGPAKAAPAEPAPELLGHHLSESAEAELGVIKSALSSGCGILRNGADLGNSVVEISEVLERARKSDDRFLRRCALVALTIADGALARAESRGDHFRTDFAARNDADFLGNFVFTLDETDELQRRFVQVGGTPRVG
jgi:aspartate oxidase